MSNAPDFDRLYALDPDPWQVSTSWYERRKIDVALACLRRRRYGRCWDVACGTGEFTAALTERADDVLGTDVSGEAIAIATRRLHGLPAQVERCGLPQRPDSLTEEPDLIVVSEVLYYLTEDDRARTYDLIDGVAAPDADLLLVNWAPQAPDTTASGLSVFNEASDVLGARGWGRLVTHTDMEFVAGVFSRDVPATTGGRDE